MSASIYFSGRIKTITANLKPFKATQLRNLGYSEVWRFEAEKWIDGEYVKRGVDPSVVQAASDALLNELERTMESASRDAWERLMEIMSKDEG